MKRAIVAMFLFGGLPLVLAGCNTVQVTTKQYQPLTGYPPTDPSSVQILRAPPLAIVERLGELYAEPQGHPSVQEIEAKMRQTAAKMGANAVVLVEDTTMSMGPIETGPWFDQRVTTKSQHVIVGVAVRLIQ